MYLIREEEICLLYVLAELVNQLQLHYVWLNFILYCIKVCCKSDAVCILLKLALFMTTWLLIIYQTGYNDTLFW